MALNPGVAIGIAIASAPGVPSGLTEAAHTLKRPAGDLITGANAHVRMVIGI